jgi:hypothetical protein
MPTYILLDDGTQAQIELLDIAHIPATGDPVQIVSLMGKLSHDVEESLLRAKCAAFQFLLRRRLIQAEQGFSLALEIFDRQGKPLAQKIRGHSGGLAFALALILHKAARNYGSMEICATGRLGNPRTGGIKGVAALADKISGGLERLPEGSIIFFPQENNGELTAHHWKQAQARGICLAPVSGLDETVAVLEERGMLALSSERSLTPSRKRRWPWVAAACALLFYLAGYFATLPISNYLLGNGRYEWVEQLTEPAQWLYWFDGRFAQLHQALVKPVQIVAELRSPTGVGEREVITFTHRSRGRLAFRGQEMWALSLKASQPLYIYLFLRDAVDELQRLFPEEPVTHENLLSANQEWVFPPPGYWRPVPSSRGREILVLVAARWPCKDLEGRCSWRESHTLMERLAWRDRQGEGAWVLRLALDPARP